MIQYSKQEVRRQMYKLTLKFNLKNKKTTILHLYVKTMAKITSEVKYVTACINANKLIWTCGTTVDPDIVKSFEWEYEADMFEEGVKS